MKSNEYWAEVRRLSQAFSEACESERDYLNRVPYPAKGDEMAEYDRVHDATLTACQVYVEFCSSNKQYRS